MTLSLLDEVADVLLLEKSEIFESHFRDYLNGILPLQDPSAVCTIKSWLGSSMTLHLEKRVEEHK